MVLGGFRSFHVLVTTNGELSLTVNSEQGTGSEHGKWENEKW